MIQSVHRAAQVLFALTESADGLGVADVAARTGLTTSTAQNLLATLAAEGFAERLSGPPRYRIGPGIAELAARQEAASRSSMLDDAVRTISSRWPQATVVQCELVAGEVIVRRRCSPELPSQIQRPLHRAMSPYTSVSGLCRLAFGTPDDRGAIERRFGLSDYGGHRWASNDELGEYLASVRAIGHAADQADGTIRASVPVYSQGNALLATLGASIRLEDIGEPDHTLADLITDLKAAATTVAGLRPKVKESPSC
jgi:DNA-binding IclR family transcriptional regulator